MKIIFVIGSINIAARLLKSLERRGFFNCALIKTPIKISTSGCSYSVVTDITGIEQIKNTAMKKKIKIKNIYKEVLKEGELYYEDIS